MKRKILFLLSVLTLVINLSAQRNVTLYADCNYAGASQSYSGGRYYLSQASFGVRQLSSMRIPNGMTVTLYTGDQPGTGDKLTLNADVSCLKSYSWNDRAVTMIIDISGGYGGNNGGNNNNNNQKGVTLYKDCNYNGPNVSLGAGNYNTNELGIGDNVLSSLKVSTGFTVTIFEDPAFAGRSTVYNADVSCLNTNWNDKVSSIRITRDFGGNNNNSGVVTLYQDCNYKGKNKALGIGYHNLGDMGIDNDALSSIRVDNGYMITVYEDNNYKGTNAVYYDDISCLPHQWNDKVSSIYVSRSDGNNTNNNSRQKVTLYENCNYEGAHNSLGIGYYDLSQLGISNDALSSLTIPPGFSVTLYKDDRQKGLLTTLTANTTCLSSAWNDKVSSIRVFRTGN